MENTNNNIKKQELLKREIIDKNLDKEEFLEYCINKKENGDDLDLWDYEELEETIKNFTKINNSKETEEKQNYQKKKKIIKKEINEDDNLITTQPQDTDDQSEKYAVNKIRLYKII
jgi:hypothetical protein